MLSGGFPVKLNLSIMLKRWGVQNRPLLSWSNSAWGHIKNFSWMQLMRGELSDHSSGFMSKSLPLDENCLITEINPSVIRVWQELSRSWTAQPGLGGRKNVREMRWNLCLALRCPVQGRIELFTLHVANGSFSAVAAAKTRGSGFILSLGLVAFVFCFFSFFPI